MDLCRGERWRWKDHDQLLPGYAARQASKEGTYTYNISFRATVYYKRHRSTNTVRRWFFCLQQWSRREEKKCSIVICVRGMIW